MAGEKKGRSLAGEVRQQQRLDTLERGIHGIIAKSYARRLRGYGEKVLQNPDILNTQKTLPVDWSAVTAASQMLIRAALLGLDHVKRKDDFTDYEVLLEVMPWDEAVEYMSGRELLSPDEYYKLSGELKAQAFTVSRLADGDLMKKVQVLLTKSLEDGTGLGEFWKQTDGEILQKIGMSGDGGYWETVWRTNMHTSYNHARAMGFENDPPLALEFLGVEDGRQSNICKVISGVILPYGHQFWQSHWPPLHFNCRSTVRGIYDKTELEGMPDGRYEVKAGGHPSKGFGTLPKKSASWYVVTDGMKERMAEYGIKGEVERVKATLTEVEKSKRKSKPTSVNWEKVKTPDYKAKFKGLTGDSKFDNTLHQKALDILEHRNNSLYEDMYLLDENGLVVGVQTHSKEKGVVTYNESLKRAVQKNKPHTLISMHNHPESSPPSSGDFASALQRRYKKGLVVCHNGDVWEYSARLKRDVKFNTKRFDMTLDKYVKKGYSLDEATVLVCGDFKDDFVFGVKKL